MFRVRNGYSPAICTFNRVATDAILKAEGLVAKAFEGGFITLMFEQVHVIATHKVVIGHTAFALAHGYDRSGYTTA